MKIKAGPFNQWGCIPTWNYCCLASNGGGKMYGSGGRLIKTDAHDEDFDSRWGACAEE